MIYFSRSRIQDVIESSDLVDECVIQDSIGHINVTVITNDNYIAYLLTHDDSELLPFQQDIKDMFPLGISISYEFI